MRNIPEIKLYGEKGCMKTHYYQLLLNKIGLPYKFLDVIENEDYASILRVHLYMGCGVFCFLSL